MTRGQAKACHTYPPPATIEDILCGLAPMRCMPRRVPSANDVAHSDGDRSGSATGSEDNPSELAFDGPWSFDERLRLIQHDTDECDVCDKYVEHYTAALADGNESLRDACEARNAAFGAAALSSVDEVRTERDQARNEAATLRLQLKKAFVDLAAARRKRAPLPRPSLLSRKRKRTQPPAPIEELTGDAVGVWIIDNPLPPSSQGEYSGRLEASN
jgi:hypothetical protein